MSNDNNAEKIRRFSAIRADMRNNNLDGLIVFGCTGTGIPKNGNYAYLSRHVPMFASSLIFFPLDGEPVLFVPGENQVLDARRTTWIGDLRLSPSPINDLCAHIKSTQPSLSTLGISSLDSLSASALQTCRETLSGISLVEASGVVLDQRKIKSADELSAIRRGAEITDLGFKRSIEVLRPGLTELQWKAAMEQVMTAAGADGGFNMLSSGQANSKTDPFQGFVVPPTDRVFARGDLALLEISPRIDGYFNQIVRLVSFGPVPEETAKAHAACLDAKRAALKLLIPGTPSVQVAEAMQASLQRHGYAMKDFGCAHTIGLDLSEAIIDLKRPGHIEQGMVATVHPMIELGEWEQLFVGETYIIEASGPDEITVCDEEIVVIH